MSFKIEYKQGDLFAVPFDKPTLVPHIVNSIGAWGSGFVLSINKYSERPRLAYRDWYNSNDNFQLGEIQAVKIPQKNVTVVNMIAQKGIGDNEFGVSPIRYESLCECLFRLCKLATENNYVIRAPMFGSNLAGGNWKIVEQIILEVFDDSNIEFTVYRL